MHQNRFMVTELMECDLSRIMLSSQPLSLAHVSFFVYQMLRGLKYMHSAGLVHRDLKPQNMLVNSDCDLKLCDFGLSRLSLAELLRESNEGEGSSMDGDISMTQYVQTRWYRAPEVLCGTKYGKPGTYVK
jgi:serine/threonine protein kinase